MISLYVIVRFILVCIIIVIVDYHIEQYPNRFLASTIKPASFPIRVKKIEFFFTQRLVGIF